MTAEATRYVSLAVDKLRLLLEKDAELRAAIQAILRADLAMTLKERSRS